MYILVAHVFPSGAVETRSRRQRSRRRQIRGAGRGPRLQVAGLYPCRRGMLGPGFRLARALRCRSHGWKWQLLGWGCLGRCCTSAGLLRVAGEDAGGVRAALPGGKGIATPRRVARGAVFAITCASAVISVLLVPFPRACKE